MSRYIDMNDLDSQSAQALAFVAWPVKEPYDPAGQARHDAAAGDGWNLPAVHAMQATVALACPLFVPERPGAHATQWERDARGMSLFPHRPGEQVMQRSMLLNPGIRLKYPAGHTLHELISLRRICAVLSPYDPALQNLHDAAASFSWY